MIRSSVLLRCSLVGLVMSCAGETTGPAQGRTEIPGSPLIRTDRTTYVAERGETRSVDGSILFGRYVRVPIRVTYTNRTAGPIYLPTCQGVNPPVLQRQDGSGWVIAYCPVVLACLGPPRVIKPGKSLDYDYLVEGYESGAIAPEFAPPVPGTYRLMWDAYGTWAPDDLEPGLGNLLPLEQRISNQFEIVEH